MWRSTEIFSLNWLTRQIAAAIVCRLMQTFILDIKSDLITMAMRFTDERKLTLKLRHTEVVCKRATSIKALNVNWTKGLTYIVFWIFLWFKIKTLIFFGGEKINFEKRNFIEYWCIIRVLYWFHTAAGVSWVIRLKTVIKGALKLGYDT